MYKTKCPACKETHTVKNGKRAGVQLYLCKACGYQFRVSKDISQSELWCEYQDRKQTVAEIAESLGVSASTVKRRLKDIDVEWTQPALSGSGFVHLDTTYWGHNWGVLLALDEEYGTPLYVAFIKHETIKDYVDAVSSIEERGYLIRGLVVDGIKGLFSEFSGHKIQMCQFHMQQIVRRYLTKKPKLVAARELNVLMGKITTMKSEDFEKEFTEWKCRWNDTINKKSTLKTGKKQFVHKSLRSAMQSVEFYLPYLFTCQLPECQGMPNTNNKIAGTFTDLKKNLNNHSGMRVVNRKRFISGFFLALKSKLERDIGKEKAPL